MAEQNHTVIIAHLDDKELRKSIDDLVGYFDKQLGSMVENTDTHVQEIQNKLKSIGETKINMSGVADSIKGSVDDLVSKLDVIEREKKKAIGTTGGDNVSITETKNNIKAVEQEIQAIENKTKAWVDSRNEIIQVVHAMKYYKESISDFEEEKTHTDLQIKAYDIYKKNIERVENQLKGLLSKRGDIPAPTKEDLQKYDELHNPPSS
jgi:chromosome segregation ATPase